MPTQRKLVIYLTCAIAAFVGLSALLRDRLVWIGLFVVFGCILADGLISGEIPFGQGGAKKIYRRRENPVAYWGAITLWSALTAAIAVLLLFGTIRPKA